MASGNKHFMGAGNSNVLLLGACGVGKSTFINYLANIFIEPKSQQPNIIIPNEIYRASNVKGYTHSDRRTTRKNESRTRSCTTYPFKKWPHDFSFIDTPGFNDDVMQAEDNIKHILDAVFEAGSLSAVCVMIDGSADSLHPHVRKALEVLSEACHEAIVNQLIVVFTKCSQPPESFDDQSLPYYSKMQVCLDNSLFSAKHVTNERFKESFDSITALLNVLAQLPSYKTKQDSQPRPLMEPASIPLPDPGTHPRPTSIPLPDPGTHPRPTKTRADYTVLVIGEKGAGKTTYINYVGNVLKRSRPDHLEKFAPIEKTTECSAYTFEGFSKRYTFIDTPGLIGKDTATIRNIAAYVSGVKSLNAILLLTKINSPRLAEAGNGVLQQLSEICPDTVRNNLVAIFTSCGSTHRELRQIPWTWSPARVFYMENPDFADTGSRCVNEILWTESSRTITAILIFVECNSTSSENSRVSHRPLNPVQAGQNPDPLEKQIESQQFIDQPYSDEDKKTAKKKLEEFISNMNASNFFDESDMDDHVNNPLESNDFKMLLIGETGAGKSSFIAWLNYFFGTKYEYVANESRTYSFEQDIKIYHFIDTPGLESSSSASQKVNQALRIGLEANELNAVVLVISTNCQKLNAYTQRCLAAIEKTSPGLVHERLIVVVTNYREGQECFNVKKALSHRPVKILFLGNLNSRNFDGQQPTVLETRNRDTLVKIKELCDVIDSLTPQTTNAFETVITRGYAPVVNYPRDPTILQNEYETEELRRALGDASSYNAEAAKMNQQLESANKELNRQLQETQEQLQYYYNDAAGKELRCSALQKENLNLVTQVKVKTDELSQQAVILARTQKELEAKNAELLTLRRDKDQRISALEKDLASARSQVQAKDDQLTAAANKIAALEQHCAAMERDKDHRISTLEKDLKNARSQVQAKDDQLTAAANKIAALEQHCADMERDKDHRISTLEKDLKNARSQVQAKAVQITAWEKPRYEEMIRNGELQVEALCAELQAMPIISDQLRDKIRKI